MNWVVILSLFLLIPAQPIMAWQSPNITDIRVATHTEYTRVVFDLKNNLPYRLNSDNSNIILNFPSGVLGLEPATLQIKDDVIEKIQVNKLGRGIRVIIGLGQRAGSFNSLLLSQPYRLVLDVQKSKNIKAVLPKKAYRIETIVIDPGHGGKDPGAIGPRGLKEKIVTLDIARRLEKILREENKLKVILTRSKDEFIPLDNRVKIANNKGTGLFISIHTNAAFQKTAGGFETFYLAESKTDSARAVVTLENSVLELEERPFWSDLGRELEKILWDLRYAEFKIESRELASIVQTNMDKRLTLTNRGTKGALLYVLRGVAMPAVLVETAFISNPSEEALLRRTSFRESVAQALADSISYYCKKIETTRGFTE